MSGVLTRTATKQDDLGGDDTLNAGDGYNIVFGGQGDDSITTGEGNDIILGDSGLGEFNTEGLITGVETTSPASGGDDTIVSGIGDDIIFGGTGSDYIDVDSATGAEIGTGEGDDIIGGDNGYISFNTDETGSVPGTFESTDPGYGGNDNIASGTGDDTVIAGTGSDNVITGAGDDTVLGDNGEIVYEDGSITGITSADETVYASGDDIIETGDGSDIVIAGTGSDTVDAGDGDNVVVGDLGRITLKEEQPSEITSISTIHGGQDDIIGGDGVDIFIGGEGGDELSGNDGLDILIGDNGYVLLNDGKPTRAETRPTQLGGDDTVLGGEGTDILIGGEGRDTVDGKFPTDVIISKYGRVDFEGYKVKSVYPPLSKMPGSPLASDEGIKTFEEKTVSKPDRSLFMQTGSEVITSTPVISGISESFGESSYHRPAHVDSKAGIRTVVLKDGSVEKTYPNGMVEITETDGTVVTTSPDGMERVSVPDGTVTLTYPNGVRIIKHPDGSSVTTYPDGRIIKVLPDGTIINSSAENEGAELRINKLMTRARIDSDGKLY